MQMPTDMGPVHILGIGGIGMSAIAEILHSKGYTVQGSDQKDSANVKRLRARGLRVFVGHDPVNLVGARYVLISSAVKPGNPELEAARARGLPIIRRAEMLAELMRLYATVSVTGTHGKTTTTSLIAHVFNAAGLDPTVITGGIINDWGSNARRGDGQWMIVEADESDGTFTKLPTQIGVVTNIDPEHLDHFETVDNMHREFETFLRNIPFYGLAVACIDHPVVSALIERLELRRDGRRLLTYGTTAGADLVLKSTQAEGGETVFDAELGRACWAGGACSAAGACRWPASTTPSMHLAAIAAASEAGIPDDAIRDGACRLLRRQAPLPAHRHLERRRHLRRLRPPSRRDRRGAEGRTRPRARARRRRGGAAPLHARARSVPGVRRQLPLTPIPLSSPPSTRRARRRSRASTMPPSPRRSAPRGTGASRWRPGSRTSRRP